MSKVKDITGQRFGRLVALEHVGLSNGRAALWRCRCDCGREKDVISSSLSSRNTRSCGCLAQEYFDSGGRDNFRHGHAVDERQTKEYRAYTNAKHRCYNAKTPAYDLYGGRGIAVCDKWRKSFENFLADMGLAPSKFHRLTRIDKQGDYEPSNCIWFSSRGE